MLRLPQVRRPLQGLRNKKGHERGSSGTVRLCSGCAKRRTSILRSRAV
jgi:hypothetical protein